MDSWFIQLINIILNPCDVSDAKSTAMELIVANVKMKLLFVLNVQNVIKNGNVKPVNSNAMTV